MDQQHLRYLGACQKSRLVGPAPDSPKEDLPFNKSPGWFKCTLSLRTLDLVVCEGMDLGHTVRGEANRLRTEAWLIPRRDWAGGGSERPHQRAETPADSSSGPRGHPMTPRAPHDPRGQAVLCLREGPLLSASGGFLSQASDRKARNHVFCIIREAVALQQGQGDLKTTGVEGRRADAPPASLPRCGLHLVRAPPTQNSLLPAIRDSLQSR